MGIIILLQLSMQKTLQELDVFPSWKEALRLSCRNNGLKTSLANTLTPIKIRGLYERLSKTYSLNPEKTKTCWYQNELKAFHWMLIVVSAVDKVLISDFSNDHWEKLQQIFKYKDAYILQYEAIRMNPKLPIVSRQWNKEQQDLLKQLISGREVANKWNDVARTLFYQSGLKFFRSGKQCRERWLNHLDPNKKRGEWTQEEDKTICEYIIKQGKKWSEIARSLGDSRTEHMVKNRFKSLIIRQKKLLPRVSNENELLKSVQDSSTIKQESQSEMKDEDDDIMKSQRQQSQRNEEEIYREKEVKPQMNVSASQIPSKETSKKSFSLIQGNENFSMISRSLRDNFSPTCDLGELDPVLRSELIKRDKSTQERQEKEEKPNFELQQIFSPFFIPTPTGNPTPAYLSPPPSMPFFMGFGQGNFGQGYMNNISLFVSNNQAPNSQGHSNQENKE